MSVDEDTAAEMQMALVRICRNERNSTGVWSQMRIHFHEFTIEEIKEAVRPAIVRMMKSLQ